MHALRHGLNMIEAFNELVGPHAYARDRSAG